MLETVGDMWEWYDEGHTLVIPTNIGWKSDGTNVMGRGVALDALHKFPTLSKSYGDFCRANPETACVLVLENERLVLVPTKPLNPKTPHLSWKYDSDLKTIERSLQDLLLQLDQLPFSAFRDRLSQQSKRIVFPLLGCGNGNLKKADVVPLLNQYLNTDLFVLCLPS